MAAGSDEAFEHKMGLSRIVLAPIPQAVLLYSHAFALKPLGLRSKLKSPSKVGTQ